MSFKAQQNAIKEQIEGVKLQRLQVRLEIEKEGLRKDLIQLERARVATQIEQIGLQTDLVGLQSAQIRLQIAQVGLGNDQDKLIYEQQNRALTQQEYQAKIQLKAINIQALREDIRHQGVMVGGGSNRPALLGG